MKIASIDSTFAHPARPSFCAANVGTKVARGFGVDSFSKLKESKYCGSTNIKDRITQKSLKVDFYKTAFSEDKSEAYFMTKEDGEIIGNMTLTIGDGAIFVADLESFQRQRYSGVGSAFIQLAVEKSLQHGGNIPIMLNAQKLHIIQRNPVGFYKKMGFQEEKNVTESDINFYGTPMSLHPKCCGEWLERIKKNPILK